RPRCNPGGRSSDKWRGQPRSRVLSASHLASSSLTSMAAPNLTAPERIGDLLLREGLISADQLSKALQEQKQSGTRVGYNLVKLGFIPEVELTKILAKQHKMPAVDLSRFEVDRKLTRMI